MPDPHPHDTARGCLLAVGLSILLWLLAAGTVTCAVTRCLG